MPRPSCPFPAPLGNFGNGFHSITALRLPRIDKPSRRIATGLGTSRNGTKPTRMRVFGECNGFLSCCPPCGSMIRHGQKIAIPRALHTIDGIARLAHHSIAQFATSATDHGRGSQFIRHQRHAPAFAGGLIRSSNAIQRPTAWMVVPPALRAGSSDGRLVPE